MSFFITLSLFIIGALLLAIRILVYGKYPLITLMILSLNLFTFIFRGTGYEINLLPTLSWYKDYLPLIFLYHASSMHLILNFVYFSIISVVAEILLKEKKYLLIYYGLPFLPETFSSIYQKLSGIPLGMGLSGMIILLTINVWTYILRSKYLPKHRVNILLILLAGVPMYSVIDWTIILALGEKLFDSYTMHLAIRHVLTGALGIYISVIIIPLILKKILSQSNPR